MTRTTRRNAPPLHVSLIEAILQERGWSVATVAVRSRTTGNRDLSVSANTLWRTLRGGTPSWPMQAEIAAALSTPENDQTITATQLFGSRPIPVWVADLVGHPTTQAGLVAA